MKRYNAHGHQNRWTVFCDWCGHSRGPDGARGLWRLTPTIDLCGICVDEALTHIERETVAAV